jgi:hypothetical protein
MCAARVSQLLNLSSLAGECGISHATARSWLSVLEASYLVFLLQPHFKNFGKRLVKTPKLYFYDPGVAAFLLNIQDIDHLSLHPLRGELFECLVVSELTKVRYNMALPSNLYFWRNNTGDEVDLIIDQGERLVPVEIKSGQTLNPELFRGLERWRVLSASEAEGYLVYGGDESLGRGGIHVVPWRSMSSIRDLVGPGTRKGA